MKLFSCLKFTWYGNKCRKIIPFTNVINDIFVYNNQDISLDIRNNNYYTLIQNISNMHNLSDSELEFIKKLPKQNLIDIIYIYDKHIDTINKILLNKK